MRTHGTSPQQRYATFSTGDSPFSIASQSPNMNVLASFFRFTRTEPDTL
jgi:hypothetical protein